MSGTGDKLFRLVTDREPGPCWLSWLRGLARGASWAYGLGAQSVNLVYDLGLKKPFRLPAPVVGVGNLTVGGTGKTPLVIEVVQALQRLGLPAAVISRGYGGQTTDEVTWVSRGEGPLIDARLAGDEPVLLARRLKVPVAVGADRRRVGAEVLAACGPRVLVGDDLFQHRRLHRDLDILALDSKDPLAGGALLPRGRLREPAAAMRRAQAVVLTRADEQERADNTRVWLRQFWGPGPVLACRHRISGLSDDQGNVLEPTEWRNRPVLAFCGLARPQAFAENLKSLGLDMMELATFPDHHFFSSAELQELWQRAVALRAEALVCSEKDRVRLPAMPAGVRLWVTRLNLDFEGGVKTLDDLLAWGLGGWGTKK